MNHRKLTEEQALLILALRNHADPQPTYAALSRQFSVTPATIERICNRTSWQHLSVPKGLPEAATADNEEG